MEDDERARWTSLLDEHEKEHPPPVVKTLEGVIIEPGFEPLLLDPAPASK